MKNKKIKKEKNKNYLSSYPRLVALSFIGLIAVGTILLMLPISTKSGNATFTEALFTATSASCVTGLVLFDTFTKWSLFGQIVILCLIQIGGLGFITIMTILTRMIKRRFSIRDELMLKESMGIIFKGDLKSLTNKVAIGTVLFELTGAIILSTQFISKMGVKNGIYTSVFLSVSAFCNAGFDVMGRIQSGSSLITVNSNPIIIITISVLIIVGGIGFIVWDDICNKKGNLKRLTIHSKIAIITTVALIIVSAVLFSVFEWKNTLLDMPVWQKLLNAFFAGVTPRTAGFNSVATGDMTPLSKALTYMLMFIGGSSGSTAGGIKTTTLAVLILCAISTLKNKKDIEIFDRRIANDTIIKSISIVIINLFAIALSTTFISLYQPELRFSDVLFECISAIGTVGMTTGITPQLHIISRIIVTLLMFIGRVTSLIFAFSIISVGNTTTVKKPTSNILIG